MKRITRTKLEIQRRSASRRRAAIGHAVPAMPKIDQTAVSTIEKCSVPVTVKGRK